MNRTTIKFPKDMLAEMEKDVEQYEKNSRFKITPQIDEFLKMFGVRISSAALSEMIKKHFGVTVSRSTLRDHIVKMGYKKQEDKE